MDEKLTSRAGVTAGLDGTLTVAAMLRGKSIAEEIQLEIEYAPDPPFHSGTPETTPPNIVKAFFAQYGHVRESRETEARRFAQKMGITDSRSSA